MARLDDRRYFRRRRGAQIRINRHKWPRIARLIGTLIAFDEPPISPMERQGLLTASKASPYPFNSKASMAINWFNISDKDKINKLYLNNSHLNNWSHN